MMAASTTAGRPAPAGHRSRAEKTADILAAFWQRLFPKRLHDIILPQNVQDQLNPDEQILLVIYQAWYRNFSAFILFNYYPVVIIGALFLSAAFGFWQLDLGLFPSPAWNMLLPFALLLFWLVYALYENFNYLKWRLVVTNNRIIFATPQRDAWYLADNIELNGKPKVVDANWSDRQFLRLMQMVTGSRDVFISLQGLQFVQGTAKVRDALVMPDVELHKVEALKRIIFSGN